MSSFLPVDGKFSLILRSFAPEDRIVSEKGLRTPKAAGSHADLFGHFFPEEDGVDVLPEGGDGGELWGAVVGADLLTDIASP